MGRKVGEGEIGKEGSGETVLRKVGGRAKGRVRFPTLPLSRFSNFQVSDWVRLRKISSSRAPPWRFRSPSGVLVGHDLAARDDDDPVADGLRLLEDVGGEDDGLFGGHVLDEVAHLVLLVGVEAVGRLVEDQHRRIVEQRLGEADALLVALGKGLDRLPAHGPEVGEVHDALDVRLFFGRRPEAPDLGDEVQKLLHRHLGVGGRVFRQVAEQALHRRRDRPRRRCRRPAPVRRSGRRKPVMIFIVVDLPAPFGPRNPRMSPRWTVKVTPSTARMAP